MTRPDSPLVLVATTEDEGLRLDRFLRDRSRVLSRIRARDLLAAGGVTLNGYRVKIASRSVHAGDRVVVHILSESRRSGPPPGMEPFRVVHEDSSVIVVDKAPGVLVQPTPQGDRGTLLDLVRRYLRGKASEGESPYLGLLHRIDRETSGLLLFTRRGAANRILAAQFRAHSIGREYLALVWGDVTPDSGTITARIRRPAPGTRRRSAGDSRLGRHAVTRFQVRRRFDVATLLSVTLETGRTHQIRIHLADRGHPVVGDRIYGSPGKFPSHPALDRFPRQALHATRLGFHHPATGQWLEFESPLPSDIAALLQGLSKGQSGEAPRV